MSSAPIGLGVFGYGLIATAHADAVRHIQGAELRAVCGPRQAGADEFGSRFGVPTATTDAAALLARADIDAILVDAPDEAHCDLTLRALAAGKHVLCEKPLAATVEECSEMVEAARHSSSVAMVGFSNRRFPWVQEAKRLIDTGGLGRVFHVQAQSLSASMLKPGARLRWRADPRRAPLGVLGDLGSHTFDLLRFLFGEVLEVCSDVRSLSDPSVANDDCVVLFRASGDVHGALAFSKLSVMDRQYGPGRRNLLISGDRGAFLFENGTARFARCDGDEIVLPFAPAAADHGGYLATATEPTLRAFVEAIRTGAPPTPSFDDGLRCAQIMAAAVRSGNERRWVAI
jgi:predicted dehydrogenase